LKHPRYSAYYRPIIADTEVESVLRELAAVIAKTSDNPVAWHYALESYVNRARVISDYSYSKLAALMLRGMKKQLPDYPRQEDARYSWEAR
jgi:hypothetical protein